MKVGLLTDEDVRWNAKTTTQQRKERLYLLEKRIEERTARLKTEYNSLARVIQDAEDLRQLLREK